ncbi:MAG: 5-histidylcysteine sulfoxide synthase [Alphaproteobacteria bacterium]|nr:5-histidylcysteine sulfoxide synthase [Alphaproteobacteria bacterium]
MSKQPRLNLDIDPHYWTGKPPVFGLCAGVAEDGTIHSLPFISTRSSRQEILDYFDNGWTLTEVLFSGLASEESYYRRPYHHLRHPLIFYYLHPVVFYVNKLRVAGLITDSFNPHVEALFEQGVDEMRWDDLHEDDSIQWPSLDEARRYRKTVYKAVVQLIKTHPAFERAHEAIGQDHPLWALFMAFEHERIHIETSSVLIRELPIEYVQKPDAWPHYGAVPPRQQLKLSAQSEPNLAFRDVAAGNVVLGKPTLWGSFGWDNEYGLETRKVDSFKATNALISNGDFYAFVASDAYQQQEYWSDLGWQWRSFRNTKWPTFWVANGPAGLHEYKLRTIFDVVAMPWDWPVIVNYHEAKAYCAWRGKQDKKSYRLLTETEHHALRDPRQEESVLLEREDPVMMRTHPFKVVQPVINHNLTYGSEQPVLGLSANSKGFHDTFGNVWQWCEDTFHPLAGFKAHPFYTDFSTPCYDNEHQMMMGGSFISTGDEASIWARFHFRPHFFQHAGFRVVMDPLPNQQIKRPFSYEDKEMVNRYLLFHWGSQNEVFDPKFSTQIQWPDVKHLPSYAAELAVRFCSKQDKALDLGCSVGRTSFALARHFAAVHGIDASEAFIDVAQQLQMDGAIDYEKVETGDKPSHCIAAVEPDIDRQRVTFTVGDACHLPESIKGYDAVILANVICRLPDPTLCLKRMVGENGLVLPGGIVVITAPMSWMEAFTPKEKWLTSLEIIGQQLPGFSLIHHEEVPFMIREHQRKFEYIIAQASVWRLAE